MSCQPSGIRFRLIEFGLRADSLKSVTAMLENYILFEDLWSFEFESSSQIEKKGDVYSLQSKWFDQVPKLIDSVGQIFTLNIGFIFIRPSVHIQLKGEETR